MKNDLKQREDVTTFLSEHAGVYCYRPLFRKFCFWLSIMGLLGLSIVIYEYSSVEQNSILATIETCVLLLFGPYFIWSSFVVARKFKEVRIDNEGISILPFGLHIAPNEVEKIKQSANFVGAGTIELKLKSPYWIFHIVAWSWGRTVTIAFNNRVLTPVVVSA